LLTVHQSYHATSKTINLPLGYKNEYENKLV